MNRNDFNLSMPFSAFCEYENYKDKYMKLTAELGYCFEKVENGNYRALNFNVKKAEEICSEFMPYQWRMLDINEII